jgi:hypothetical protein
MSRYTRTTAAVASARATRDIRVWPNTGRLASGRRRFVPLVDAIPFRFQGPMMRYTASPLATKSKPRPPKISFTRPRVFRTPTRSAHNAPPTMPATIIAAIRTAAAPGKVRPTHVAAMAPMTI